MHELLPLLKPKLWKIQWIYSKCSYFWCNVYYFLSKCFQNVSLSKTLSKETVHICETFVIFMKRLIFLSKQYILKFAG